MESKDVVRHRVELNGETYLIYHNEAGYVVLHRYEKKETLRWYNRSAAGGQAHANAFIEGFLACAAKIAELQK